MPGVRRLPSGKLQGWYRDAAGRRRYWTAEDPKASKAQVRAIVARLEDDHHQVRLGYRPARTTADRHRTRPLTELVTEYLAWGQSQGGLGGRAWSGQHADHRQAHLIWWRQRLGLETVGDLAGILPRAEGALRELLATHTGRTAAAYTESLRALCLWAERRGYLDGDPLRGMAAVDASPRRQRRALTPAEAARLLSAAPPDRSLLYAVAMASGLRAGELRHLDVGDLDAGRGGLILHAEWTKNRRPGFQPLPTPLLAQLAAYAGLAAAAYAGSRPRTATTLPDRPLLCVPQNTGRTLAADLAAAGIPRWTPDGHVDFHSLRVTFVTLLCESGATVKELQALARHSSPSLTMGRYATARESGLAAAVDRLGGVLSRTCAPGAHAAPGATGPERVSDGPSMGNAHLSSG